MSKMTTTLTGAAGEHYVAYKLASMGYVVAMTRGGSPTVDLIIGDLLGNSISLQVKTSRNAYRRKKGIEGGIWEWDVSIKVRDRFSDKLFYAFVDLKGSNGDPDVFIVPSQQVAQSLNSYLDENPEKASSRLFYWLTTIVRQNHYDRWDLIAERLKPAVEPAAATADETASEMDEGEETA